MVSDRRREQRAIRLDFLAQFRHSFAVSARGPPMAKIAKGLTISRRKNGSHRAQIRKVGFPYQSKDFLTHRDADEWGRSRLAEMERGDVVDRRSARRTTFGEMIDLYIAEVTEKRPGEASRVAERARLERFRREERTICAHALAHLTPQIFEEWRDRRLKERPVRGTIRSREIRRPKDPPPGRLRKDGTSRANASTPKAPKPQGTIKPSTVHREMTVLKRVLDFAMRRHALTRNPLDKAAIDWPSALDERDVRLTSEESERLLGECRNSKNAWLAPFVELAREIGARRGSLLKLPWSDVHPEQKRAVLRGVKNSRAPSEVRTVEVGLSPRAIKILRSLPRSEDPRVFPVHMSALKSAFDRARTRAKVGHFRLHDERHEFASAKIEAGWGLLDLMAQGDWRDPKSLKRYFNPSGSHLGEMLANTAKKKQAKRVKKQG
jgi:integrase